MSAPLSEREAELMRHALGIQQRGRRLTPPYRNYFDAAGDDVAIWDGLARRGLAVLTGRATFCPNPTMYHVTAAGKAALGYGYCAACGNDEPLLPGSQTTLAAHSAPRPTRQVCPGSGKEAGK